MDGTPKAGGGKDVLPVPAGSDGDAGAGATSSARVALRTTSLAAADAPAVAAAGAAGRGGEEEEDDEQVERFYALLDNIRAMRGAYGGGARSKKRLRGSEPPWRPAFRLEDFEFEEPSPSPTSSDAAPCAKRAEEARGAGRAQAQPSRRHSGSRKSI